MLVKDWYAHRLRSHPDPALLDTIATALGALTGAEFEAEAFICWCSAILPLLPPYDTAHAHIRTHPDTDLKLGLLDEFWAYISAAAIFRAEALVSTDVLP